MLSRGWLADSSGLLPIAVGLYLCTAPVQDSDLWYHLAYARQMVESGSLRLDHAAFSWTPASDAVIYCAWMAQLLLYGLHQLGGLTALFAARYLAFVSVVLAWLWFASRRGLLSHPVSVALMTAGIWTMSDGVALKPQLFSVLCLTITAGIHAWVRLDTTARARWLFVWPLVMAVWVNTHGGFTVGLVYQVSTIAGAWLDRNGSRHGQAADTYRQSLLLACAASCATVLLTPYGVAYPLQFLTVQLPAADLAAVRDYDSIFSPHQAGMRYLPRGIVLVALCVGAWMVRRPSTSREWAVVLPIMVFAGLYASLIRLTAFLAPVAVFGVLSLLVPRAAVSGATARAHRRWHAVALVALLAYSVIELRADEVSPPIGSWRGLGNGYVNPEDEAAYIARYFPGARLGNDYNTGGYLLWALAPTTRVFIDARYFPYQSWFEAYRRFESGQEIAPLLQQYPADVWVVHLALPTLTSWFRQSSDWQTAFIGRSAAVFVRRGLPLPSGKLLTSPRLADIRNLHQAMLATAVSLDAGAVDAARRTVEGMRRTFDRPADRALVSKAAQLVDGMTAYSQGDDARAVTLLRPIAADFQGIATRTLAAAARRQAAALWDGGRDDDAFAVAREIVAWQPQAATARYNLAVMAWWVERSTGQSTGVGWRSELEALAQLPGANSAELQAAVAQARQILAGQRTDRPRLLKTP